MSKLRESARGQECTLQIFPHCNEDPETVVLCHINSESKGMGIKSEDFFGVYGCSDCHAILDGRLKTDIPKAEILECVLRGLHRTWKIWVNEGLIEVPKDGTKKRRG